MGEVAIVSPQSLGPFTGLYKKFTPFIKQKPLRTLMITSTLATFFLYLFLGSLLVKIASLLQFGF